MDEVLVFSKNSIFLREVYAKAQQYSLKVQFCTDVNSLAQQARKSTTFLVVVDFQIAEAQALMAQLPKISHLPVVLVAPTQRLKKLAEWQLREIQNIFVIERLPSAQLLFSNAINFAQSWFCQQATSERMDKLFA